MPLTFVRSLGNESLLPGLMSLTKTVPAAVPLLFQSSAPWTPSLAMEEQRAVHVRQVARIRAAAAGVDVLDQDGAGGGAIAFPEFKTVHPVVGREVSRRADGRKVGPARRSFWPLG